MKLRIGVAKISRNGPRCERCRGSVRARGAGLNAAGNNPAPLFLLGIKHAAAGLLGKSSSASGEAQVERRCAHVRVERPGKISPLSCMQHKL
jgi:hypothetical protein